MRKINSLLSYITDFTVEVQFFTFSLLENTEELSFLCAVWSLVWRSIGGGGWPLLTESLFIFWQATILSLALLNNINGAHLWKTAVCFSFIESPKSLVCQKISTIRNNISTGVKTNGHIASRSVMLACLVFLKDFPHSQVAVYVMKTLQIFVFHSTREILESPCLSLPLLCWNSWILLLLTAAWFSFRDCVGWSFPRCINGVFTLGAGGTQPHQRAQGRIISFFSFLVWKNVIEHKYIKNQTLSPLKCLQFSFDGGHFPTGACRRTLLFKQWGL